MKTDVKGTVRRWIEALRSVGFFLSFVLGAGLVGFCISWPLWFFSTHASRVYTFAVLSLIGAGVIALIVRAFLRKRGAAEDLSRPRTTFVTAVLTLTIVIVGIAGLFGAAAWFARHQWLWGATDVLVWVAALWLLGRARRYAKRRKAAPFPAENLK